MHKKKDENVTESAFFNNFRTIFIGDLDEKIKFTFKMYDFDNDGFITPEDIRILMSYMPFDHNVQLQDVEGIIQQRGFENLNSTSRSRLGSPSNRARQSRQRAREGMYQEGEGKNVDYNDRIHDQEEIKAFTDKIFKSGIAGVTAKQMSFKQYEYIIKTVSSEMFYSLMSLLHEKLPCATNYFRLRKQFKEKNNQKRKGGEDLSSSPIRTIASPKMIRGLSITK